MPQLQWHADKKPDRYPLARQYLPGVHCRPRGRHDFRELRLTSYGSVKPGHHRTRQRCSGPVCDRPSKSRSVPSRQNRLQAPLTAVLTGRKGPGRARTAANRAGRALTDAVRTGLQRSLVRQGVSASYKLRTGRGSVLYHESTRPTNTDWWRSCSEQRLSTNVCRQKRMFCREMLHVPNRLSRC